MAEDIGTPAITVACRLTTYGALNNINFKLKYHYFINVLSVIRINLSSWRQGGR
jgi:hypothetical protein